MRCEAVVERLDAFRTKELEPQEQRRVAVHMRTCRECAEELTAVEELADACASLRRRAPADLKESVLAAAGERYGSVQTDVGSIRVSFNERGITSIGLEREEHPMSRVDDRRPSPADQASELPPQYSRAVRKAIAGKDPGQVTIDLATLPPFQRAVLETLSRIPRGEVRSYAWVAQEIGQPRAVRAVGNALARNPVPFLLPCHRVVPTRGGLGGYALGGAMKAALLKREGVAVEQL